MANLVLKKSKINHKRIHMLENKIRLDAIAYAIERRIWEKIKEGWE
jgi:hypothetical protein